MPATLPVVLVHFEKASPSSIDARLFDQALCAFNFFNPQSKYGKWKFDTFQNEASNNSKERGRFQDFLRKASTLSDAEAAKNKKMCVKKRCTVIHLELVPVLAEFIRENQSENKMMKTLSYLPLKKGAAERKIDSGGRIDMGDVMSKEEAEEMLDSGIVAADPSDDEDSNDGDHIQGTALPAALPPPSSPPLRNGVGGGASNDQPAAAAAASAVTTGQQPASHPATQLARAVRQPVVLVYFEKASPSSIDARLFGKAKCAFNFFNPQSKYGKWKFSTFQNEARENNKQGRFENFLRKASTLSDAKAEKNNKRRLRHRCTVIHLELVPVLAEFIRKNQIGNKMMNTLSYLPLKKGAAKRKIDSGGRFDMGDVMSKEEVEEMLDSGIMAADPSDDEDSDDDDNNQGTALPAALPPPSSPPLRIDVDSGAPNDQPVAAAAASAVTTAQQPASHPATQQARAVRQTGMKAPPAPLALPPRRSSPSAVIPPLPNESDNDSNGAGLNAAKSAARLSLGDLSSESVSPSAGSQRLNKQTAAKERDGAPRKQSGAADVGSKDGKPPAKKSKDGTAKSGATEMKKSPAGSQDQAAMGSDAL